MRCGLPSTSSYACVMTGMSRAACTMAQAIRWVKESLRPPSLRALRRCHSVSTSSVRKLVAVGIERLSFMKRASVAAGPRIGVRPASRGGAFGGAGAGAGAVAPPPFDTAASTSAFVTRPRGPEPSSALTSTPFALAIRAATGVAFTSPFPASAGCAGRGSAVSAGARVVSPPGMRGRRSRRPPRCGTGRFRS